MNQYEKIKQIVASLEEDVIKFYEKGNNLAGTRVRKGLQDLKKAAQDMRIAVQSMKKGPEAK